MPSPVICVSSQARMGRKGVKKEFLEKESMQIG
jgi:hypothetical protein